MLAPKKNMNCGECEEPQHYLHCNLRKVYDQLALLLSNSPFTATRLRARNGTIKKQLFYGISVQLSLLALWPSPRWQAPGFMTWQTCGLRGSKSSLDDPQQSADATQQHQAQLWKVKAPTPPLSCSQTTPDYALPQCGRPFNFHKLWKVRG